jgi:hypothetical protein
LKLGRRPGSFTSFVDSFTEETILRVEASSSGEILVTFRLYDCHGTLVQDSDGGQSYPAGAEVRADDDEVLLSLPSDDEGLVSYCLYNRSGTLLTRSDGMRTQLFGGVRIIGNKPLSGRPPAAKVAPAVAE